MDEPRDYHIKWSKSEKDKYDNIIFLYVESIKWYRWTYLQNTNKLTDIENKLGVAKEDARSRGRDKLGGFD